METYNIGKCGDWCKPCPSHYNVGLVFPPTEISFDARTQGILSGTLNIDDETITYPLVIPSGYKQIDLFSSSILYSTDGTASVQYIHESGDIPITSYGYYIVKIGCCQYITKTGIMNWAAAPGTLGSGTF